jgi:hypothetical protein
MERPSCGTTLAKTEPTVKKYTELVQKIVKNGVFFGFCSWIRRQVQQCRQTFDFGHRNDRDERLPSGEEILFLISGRLSFGHLDYAYLNWVYVVGDQNELSFLLLNQLGDGVGA